MSDIGNTARILPYTPEIEAPPADVPVDTATILVVEDDIHLMEGIREILELDNYKVITASSGLEGLDTLRSVQGAPDLIVSDIMMPKMDGYQFFEAVRSVPQWLTIPFIFLTAKGEKADIRLGKSMGADDYVTKPFSAEDLLVAVTAKIRRIEALRKAYSNMLSEMKRRILTILNHEFRTPLTYVIAYADMLTRDADELSVQELREFLKGIGAGADRLRRLIENFIMLVELDAKEVEKTYEWRRRSLRDYNRLIELSLKKEMPFLVEKNQQVKVDIAEQMLPIIGDEEYLSSAIAQLIDNASKFSDDGAVIHVKVYMDEAGLPTISVIDTGRGVPGDELEKIFDPFYQVNRQQYEDQGAGSGLAIVRGVAQVHEAEITVHSIEGKGSTFSLHFPVADPS